MRVLKEETIYECQQVVKRNYEVYGKKGEFCLELMIPLIPVHPLNRQESFRVTTYTDIEKTKLLLAFNSLLENGFADLNAFEYVEQL